jgi:two-component system, cell cycle sensor histidine kinase and response regulator CckA
MFDNPSTFRLLVEQAPEPIFVCTDLDSGHVIHYVNPAMEHLLGYRAGELLGAAAIDRLVHVDDREAVALQGVRRQRGAPVGEIALRWVSRDGETIPVRVRATTLELEVGAALLVTASDQRERLRHEAERDGAVAALRASEQLHRLLFEGSPLPSWVFDPESLRFLAVNPAMVMLHGYSKDELLAMRLSELKPPEDVPSLVEGVATAEVGSTCRVGTQRHRAKDGRVIEIDVTSHVVMFEGKRAIIGVGLDVTERSSVEEQLRQSQKMEAVGRLAGGIAHDLNNILAVILSSASFVRDRLGTAHALAPEVDDIEAAAGRAAALTQQLLAFSRKQPRKPKPLALNAVVTDLEKMLSRIVGEDIVMSAHLATNLGTVVADAAQVEQVLMNLVVNARDAMPRGGRLAIETNNVVVDAGHAKLLDAAPGRYVVLAVSDTGCGMDAATQQRIFEPFFTTKQVGTGSGLGLSTVFGIVRQSDGAITVYSERDRGSTFRVYLPRVDEVVPEVVTSPGRPEPIRGSGTVLLVEDDPYVRRVIRRQLEALGYALIEVPDARSALAVVRDPARTIDLLVTDLVMPGMDGRALAIQVTTARPGLRVLYMSGYTEYSAMKTAALAPDDHFVAKPFTAAVLSVAVSRALAASG